MSVSVDGRLLGDALARVALAVGDGKNIPILGTILFHAAEQRLTLAANNLSLSIVASIPCIGDMHEVCVEEERLSAFLKRVSDRGFVSVELGDGFAEFKVGRASARVGTMDPIDFPRLEVGASVMVAEVEAGQLASVCGSLEPAVHTGSDREYLTGVHFERGSVRDPKANSSLVAVATDGHKLYARSLDAAVQCSSSTDRLILPLEAVKVLKRLLKAGEATLEFAENGFSCRAGALEVRGRLVEGIYPDWRRVMPTRPPSLSFDCKGLLNAVHAARAATQSTKKGRPIRLIFGEESTEITSAKPEAGSSGSDICDHSVLAAPACDAVGVNGDYLVEMLEALGGETAQISIGAETEPLVLTAAAVADRKIVLMPLRS